MDLQKRLALLKQLKDYMVSDAEAWLNAQENAAIHNTWFLPSFIKIAVDNITKNYLDEQKLAAWTSHYFLTEPAAPKTIGLVMAGNIPLVGFHDFLSVFVSGHRQLIKLSSKDNILLKHLVEYLSSLDNEISAYVKFAEMLKDCDAYIATGSNNSGRYFDYYFSRYPNIIRRNKTSVAILNGHESKEDLKRLSDDIHLYFGLGCRNVSKLLVREGYNFEPLLESFENYSFFAEHHKYKNNYDYQLSILLLNNRFYMTDGTTLLLENDSIFSPIAQLHYEYYKPGSVPDLTANSDLQCIVSNHQTGFGKAQSPGLFDYADGIDTMQFLLSL